MNTLTIGDAIYPLGEVYLYLEAMTDNDNGLIANLFADSQDLTQAGFAINCFTLPNATQISRTFFEFPAGEMNELAESVLREPEGTLEFSKLQLTFGSANSGFVNTLLEAVCYKFGSDNEIPVRGEFDARIVRRKHRDTNLQPSLFDA